METTLPSPKITYPYLPEGRTILHVGEDNKYMVTAKETALKYSTDRKNPTGAVIVDESGNILVSASNQTPIRNKFLLETHKSWCIRKLFRIPSGQKYWLCPGCADSSSHAEYRASTEFLKAFPQKTNTSRDLYLWGHWWCCKPCWDKMIEAGIRDVYLENLTK